MIKCSGSSSAQANGSPLSRSRGSTTSTSVAQHAPLPAYRSVPSFVQGGGDGADVGSDGCGGACGVCGAGERCDVRGACVWRDGPRLRGGVAKLPPILYPDFGLLPSDLRFELQLFLMATMMLLPALCCAIVAEAEEGVVRSQPRPSPPGPHIPRSALDPALPHTLPCLAHLRQGQL